jgi:cell division protein FtsZ
MMRVSVVATGIDAAVAVSEVPVPRRRLAEPLQPVERVEEKLEAAYPTETRSDAEERHLPAARAQRQQVEPMLFDEIDPTDVDEQAEAMFDDEQSDELPAPAYRPQPPRFQPQADYQDDDFGASQFVAPKAGMPSPDAMARLRAAVDKSPHAATARAVQEPAEPASEKHRFGINSLIGRMTGHPAEAQARRPQQAPRRQPPMQSVDEQPEVDGEQERIEIPAFLRRQAN